MIQKVLNFKWRDVDNENQQKKQQKKISTPKQNKKIQNIYAGLV